jgi:hypothetical protein
MLRTTAIFHPMTVAAFSFFIFMSTLSAQDHPSNQELHRSQNDKTAKSFSAAGIVGRAPMDSTASLFLPPEIYFPDGDWTVEIADLNGDGHPDLVVANQYGIGQNSLVGSIGVFMGNGDGTFQPEVNYSSGGSDYYAARAVIADVNGDGKPDVLVANEGFAGEAATVGVLLGNGDGTFQNVVTYAVMNPSTLAVADLNGDGKPDLVVGSCCNQTVSVLLGNGDGTFQSPVVYPSVGYLITDIAVADLTGNGKPDLLVAGGTGIGVYRGNGDGTFQPFVLFSFDEFGPNSMIARDINGDGKVDLIIGGTNAPGLLVLIGNGDGTFQSPVAYSSGGSSNYVPKIILGDVNDDGKPDLLVSTATFGVGATVGVLLGNGDGTFQPSVTYPSGAVFDLWLAVADLNGDGKNDVVVANGNPANIGILLNNTGEHGPTTTTLVSNANPAFLSQDVFYTAIVTNESGKAITRSVVFQDGGGEIATVPVVGNQATYMVSYLKVGIHTITAVYTGDVSNLGSTSPSITEYAERFPIKTTMTLTSTGSPSVVGRPVTFTAAVTWNGGPIPNGQAVVFEDDGKVLATVPLAGGTASYTTLALTVSTHHIKASYAANATFKTSAETISQIVERHATTTVLSASPNPSIHSQAITFTAIVSTAGRILPTGKVLFKDGTQSLNTKTLSGGVATLTKSNLALGTHSITATYEGDVEAGASASPAVIEVVN